jgi:sigma-B regulation protein RsbU (phosphoserine phosphatase)
VVDGGSALEGAVPEQLLADALEALEFAVCIADARLDDLPVVWANPAFERTTGYPVRDVLGRNCRFLHEGLPPQPELDVVRSALARQQAVTVVLTNRRADGETFLNELSLTPLHDDTGEVTHVLAVQRDVTAEVDAAEKAGRLGEEQAELTYSLQRHLVPHKLPEVPGLDVAVRYSPGAASADGTTVSGDFYDLFASSTTVGGAATWHAAIGDVAGRGPAAASYTGTVRNLLKGIALREGSPAHALELLNAALLDELGDRFVTVALAQLQVRQDRVRATVALGRHPPPVLVHDGEARLVGEPGDLLGVLPGAAASDSRVSLHGGDTLLMYTDGITEAGPADDLFGDERLLQAAEDSVGSADDVVDGVLSAVQRHDGGTDDDSALLALRVVPPEA